MIPRSHPLTRVRRRAAASPRRAAAAAGLAVTFLAVLAYWTYLLVKPNPIPEIADEIPADWRFLAAKCLHASAYAALTVLALVLPLPAAVAREVRLGLVALLVLHGAGTEVAQTYVPNRSGKVRDVLIDWAGIAAGVAAWRYLGSRLPRFVG